MEKMLTDFHFIRKVKHQVADIPANLGPFQLQFIWIVYTLKKYWIDHDVQFIWQLILALESKPFEYCCVLLKIKCQLSRAE